MKQVLLLDDDATQLSVRQLLLRRGGVESQTSTRALDALELLASEAGREAIGAVITDHIMPGIDGAEFVRRLRAFDPYMPVIVVSGMPDAEDAYRGQHVIFLVKPCEPEDLIALVKAALAVPHRNDVVA
jgi:DNA-binding NtrC family response regulator